MVFRYSLLLCFLQCVTFLWHISCRKYCTMYLNERNLLMLKPLPRWPHFSGNYMTSSKRFEGYIVVCVSLICNIRETHNRVPNFFHICMSVHRFLNLNPYIYGFWCRLEVGSIDEINICGNHRVFIRLCGVTLQVLWFLHKPSFLVGGTLTSMYKEELVWPWVSTNRKSDSRSPSHDCWKRHYNITLWTFWIIQHISSTFALNLKTSCNQPGVFVS